MSEQRNFLFVAKPEITNANLCFQQSTVKTLADNFTFGLNAFLISISASKYKYKKLIEIFVSNAFREKIEGGSNLLHLI